MKKIETLLFDMDGTLVESWTALYKAAGVYTCAVTYGIGKPEDIQAAEPDHLIDDIRELIDIIAK